MKKKKLGEFTGSQVVFEGISLLPRIPHTCEEANESSYELWKEGIDFIGVSKPRYVIFCKHCGERLELDIEEYLKINKIISLNKKLRSGKIDSEEHLSEIDKVKNKLLGGIKWKK